MTSWVTLVGEPPLLDNKVGCVVIGDFQKSAYVKKLHLRPYMATKRRCVWNITFLLVSTQWNNNVSIYTSNSLDPPPPPHNQNAGFESHDNRQKEDDGHFCFVVRHNADRHYLLPDNLSSLNSGTSFLVALMLLSSSSTGCSSDHSLIHKKS